METTNHISALAKVLEVLEALAPERRRQVLETARAFFLDSDSVASSPVLPSEGNSVRTAQVPFSEKRDITISEFMAQKQPTTGVARVVCQAFYLKHYRNLTKFHASDITLLNSELGEHKATEVSRRLLDAENQRYILRLPGGRRQITSRGEIFVLSMPFGESNDRQISSSAIKHSLHSEKLWKVEDPLTLKIEASSTRRRSHE